MRYIRTLLRAARVVAAIVVVLLTAVVLVTQTPWFRDWLRRYAMREAAQFVNGQLIIGRIDGGLWGGVQLHDLRLEQQGATVASVDMLELDYRLLDFIRDGVVVRRVAIVGPRLALARRDDEWNVTSLLVEQDPPADPDAPRATFRVDTLSLSNGVVTIDDPSCPAGATGCLPERLDDVRAEMQLASTPERLAVRIDTAGFTTSEPALALREFRAAVEMNDRDISVAGLSAATVASRLAGHASVRDYTTAPDVDARLSASPLSLAEVARFAPQLGTTTLAPTVDLEALGPLEALRVGVHVSSDAGTLRAALVADAAAPRYAVDGRLSTEAVDIGRILGDPALATRLTINATVDVAGEDVPSLAGTLTADASASQAMGYQVDAVTARAEFAAGDARVQATARAYGAALSAAGSVGYANATEGEVSYTVTGRLRNLDVRRLPASLGAPRVSTDVNLDYDVTGNQAQTRAQATLLRSTIDTAVIDQGTVVGATVAGRRVSYAVTGSIRALDLQRMGRTFGVDALDRPALTSDITARVDVEGEGTEPATAAVRAAVVVTDSTLAGVRIPLLEADATLGGGAARLHAQGRVADVDPGRLSGREDVSGVVGGTFTVTASIPDVAGEITPASLTADARVDLDPSTVAEVALEQARADVSLAAGVATVRELTVVSPLVDLNVSGTFALVDGTDSRLTYAVHAKDLGGAASLAGTPGVSGQLRTDGVVTGWLEALSVSGSLEASDVVYGEAGSVSTVGGEYDVTLPALDPAAVRAGTSLVATNIDASGTVVDRLTLAATYTAPDVDIELDAVQDEVAVGLGGVVHLDTETARQDVALRRLSLTGDGLAWALAPGAEPRISHQDGVVTVDDVRMADGDQRLAVAGGLTLPREDQPLTTDALAVELEAVDIAPLVARVAPERGAAGQLDASLTHTGTLADGRGTATVTLRNGGVHGYTFDSLAATGALAGGVAELDATLQQDERSSLTVKGRVPATAFGAEASAAAALDLTVTSTPIDLAILEGMTTAVEDVRGTLQVDAHVAGTVSAPLVNGTLRIGGGALRVALVDAVYDGIEADVRVSPELVQVERLQVRDSRGNPLEVRGTLGVQDAALGAVELVATAADFRVLDNDLGDLRLTADLRVSGTPAAPVVRGTVSVPSSRVEVDRVLLALAQRDEDAVRDDVDLVYEPPPTTTAAVVLENELAPAPAASAIPRVSDAPLPPAVDADDPATPAQDAGTPRALADATIDVQLTIPDDLVLRGDDIRLQGGGTGLGAMNLTVGADLRASQAPGEPLVVTGAINTVRGYYDFQGRRFTVERDGTIRFQGSDVTDPSLAIAATREISGVEARVGIEGTAEAPRLVLSSTPSLDEADILALIIFNQPLDDLGTGEQVSLAQRAGELVGGRLVGSLATSLRDALDVDQLEIDAFGTGGPSVTVGNRVGERIYVRLRQQLGTQDLSQLLVEYALLRNLRLQTSVIQGAQTDRSPGQRVERSGIDLFYFFFR